MTSIGDTNDIHLVARSVAEELGELDGLEGWLKEQPLPDYGAAPASGGDPSQLLMIWEIATVCWRYVADNAPVIVPTTLATLELVDRFLSRNKRRNDFSREEIIKAFEAGLAAARKSPNRPLRPD